jgi:hypothetical protein
MMVKRISTYISLFMNVFYLEVLSVSGKCGPTIPAQISKMTNLRFLNASNCGFEGTLPTSIGQLRQLGKYYHTVLF